MTWIEAISAEQATGKLKDLYDRISSADGHIDNIMLAHSLRPHTLEAHLGLYKATLHHAGNTLPRWLLEAVGVYVSMLNGCEYCVAHHWEGMRRLLGDDERAEQIRKSLAASKPAEVFEGMELAAMRYARGLTIDPGEMQRGSIIEMRREGLDDGAILELNQVVSYFSYANRTVLGLGIAVDGDVLGLSPSGEGLGHQ